MLPLTFSNLADYDCLRSDDQISLLRLSQLAPKRPVIMVVNSKNGRWEITISHTFNKEQIAYFLAGSVLNLMALKTAEGKQRAVSTL